MRRQGRSGNEVDRVGFEPQISTTSSALCSPVATTYPNACSTALSKGIAHPLAHALSNAASAILGRTWVEERAWSPVTAVHQIVTLETTNETPNPLPVMR